MTSQFPDAQVAYAPCTAPIFIPVSYRELLCDRKNNFRANGNIAEISGTSTCETKTIAEMVAVIRASHVIATGVDHSDDQCWFYLHSEGAQHHGASLEPMDLLLRDIDRLTEHWSA
jgi:hypothetical protein